MALQVIGAGFGRTGTLSMQRALDELGFGPTYHNRLLVFDVAEGWGPLCDFLDVPVPSEPFPNLNDRAALKRRFTAIHWVTRLGPVGLVTAAAALLRRRLTSAA